MVITLFAVEVTLKVEAKIYHPHWVRSTKDDEEVEQDVFDISNAAVTELLPDFIIEP